jgi:hypothetical protein
MTPADFSEMEKWLSSDSLHDVTVQFRNPPPYAPEILAAVNQLCGRYGDQVQVSFQWENMDGSFKGTELRQLPDLVSLMIMSERPVAEIRCLWELPKLRRLDLGVKRLNDPDLLRGDNLQQLISLEISQWGTRPLDLAPVAGMTQLEMLRLARPMRNVEALARLPRLKSLYLYLVQQGTPLERLEEIANLHELLIMSGSRTELAELRHPTLKKLHIQDVRGLTGFDTTQFPGLEEFSMHFQAQVTGLACSSANANLKRIVVLHCIRLARFHGLRELPSLEHFAVVECPVNEEQLRNG